MNVQIDVPDFENFIQKDLEGIWRKHLNKAVRTIKQELQRRVEKKSPVGDYPASTGKIGGLLRASWIATDPIYKGNRIEFTIYNTAVSDEGAPYPTYVEYGHRIVRHGVTLGWQPGQHFLRDSLKEVQQLIPRIIDDAMQDAWQEMWQ